MTHRVGHTRDEEAGMLKSMGLASFEDLKQQVPEEQRLQKPLDLPPPLPEARLRERFAALSRQNYDAALVPSFLGAGLYDHDRPAVVTHLIQRSEFATAYTPYQAEVSQGTLAAIFEFQTTICELTGLDVANASLYDGGSACGEALWMAMGATRRNKVLVSAGVNPLWRRVVDTYLDSPGVTVETLPHDGGRVDPEELKRRLDDDTAAVVVQHPNAFGLLEESQEVGRAVDGSGAHLVALVDPVSLAILKPPAAWGATTAVGEGQFLAIPPTYGGPLLGFMATRKKHLRRMPGRLVAEAEDADGDRGFVLTLQTREQHIRRARATSNICTNNSLIALGMQVTLSLLGPQGLREMAEGSLRNAWRTREALLAIPGVESPFSGPFFREFVVDLPREAEEVVQAVFERCRILCGVPGRYLWPDHPERLLVAATEKRTPEEIDNMARCLKGVLTS
ncbi:MAG: aminomethyl-transferring glycine dehydrogenase subunit GcvPA [Candidatus Eisenbacteria bacterium]|nr:aminomethyl-transferring glycine dehydrogenase subunit GcvPA [Candidatus Eisenbacteria bacterium]